MQPSQQKLADQLVQEKTRTHNNVSYPLAYFVRRLQYIKPHKECAVHRIFWPSCVGNCCCILLHIHEQDGEIRKEARKMYGLIKEAVFGARFK